MLPILLDEGLPWQVAEALRAAGLEAFAVGHDPEAPPDQSDDDVNVKWCQARGSVLVTNDRGRKEKVILRALAAERVHALFVYKDLRAAPPHALLKALLVAEERMEQLAAGRGLIHHKLKSTGRLAQR
jgi:hypothetical protein